MDERPTLQGSISLSTEEVDQRMATHDDQLGDIIRSYKDRKSRQLKHPVHDFLFTYYNYPAGKLLKWHPAWNESVPSDHPIAEQLLSNKKYMEKEGQVFLQLNSFHEKEWERLIWILNLLKSTRDRPAQFGCFGLHEWAMVYKHEDHRHEDSPLRLPQETVDSFLRSQNVVCSHFDAFRFFTPSAKPMNAIQPTQDDRPEYEQAGCIHANLDLYKWCYKLAPLTGSDLLRRAFMVAWKGREIDMRASPYELSDYGYIPIYIETEEGRNEYIAAQKGLTEAAAPVRQEMITLCENVIKIR